MVLRKEGIFHLIVFILHKVETRSKKRIVMFFIFLIYPCVRIFQSMYLHERPRSFLASHGHEVKQKYINKEDVIFFAFYMHEFIVYSPVIQLGHLALSPYFKLFSFISLSCNLGLMCRKFSFRFIDAKTACKFL